MRSLLFSISRALCGPVVLAFLLAMVLPLINPPSTLAASTIYVGTGETYASIQEAVDAASDGDTIIVRDGIYIENVDVNKRLIIQSENGADSTKVQAAISHDHVFDVAANYVTLRGFTVVGATGSSKAGVYLAPGSDKCKIKSNNIGYDSSNRNKIGIYLNDGSNNEVSHNNIQYNKGYGIYLCSSCNNEVYINIISQNNDGISLSDSSHSNAILNNTISGVVGDGIHVESSDNNNISDNDVSDSASGSGITLCNALENVVSNNAVSSNSCHGISLEGASDNNLHSNKTSCNIESGIALDDSFGNTISSNAVWENASGISLDGSSDNNVLFMNEVSSNACGISLKISSGNAIYLNNFENNTSANVASVDSDNAWETPESINYDFHDQTGLSSHLGNHWSDYSGEDDDNDGIGDTPHAIDTDDEDTYPLTEGFENYRSGPMANFTAEEDGTAGDEPFNVAFTDDSSSQDGIVTWSWDFGDGTIVTTDEPTIIHRYLQDSTYTVALTVYEADGDTSTEIKTDYIAVHDTGPTADFSADSTSSDEPLTVNFTDESISHDGIITWNWDFGDGEISSEQNPTHEYAQNGAYTVTLTVTELDEDTATETKSDYITVLDTAPTADFSADPINGTEPLSISLTDLSVSSHDDIVAWSWNFGDGNGSNEQNPTHEYLQNGTYTITLTAYDADGTSTTNVKADYINVDDTEPTAGFSADPASGNEPLSVTFTDNSISPHDGIESWSWDFGDGETSNAQNPSHTYSQENTYTVTLVVTEPDGDTSTETRTIAVDDTGPTASFSAEPTEGAAPLIVTFTDESSSHDGIVGWSWDFGDDSHSTEQNPEHTYVQEGTYTVTLTVTESDGNTDAMTTDIEVSATPPEEGSQQDDEDDVTGGTLSEGGGTSVWIWVLVALSVLLIPAGIGGGYLLKRRTADDATEYWPFAEEPDLNDYDLNDKD